jgi:hypothetical protein
MPKRPTIQEREQKQGRGVGIYTNALTQDAQNISEEKVIELIEQKLTEQQERQHTDVPSQESEQPSVEEASNQAEDTAQKPEEQAKRLESEQHITQEEDRILRSYKLPKTLVAKLERAHHILNLKGQDIEKSHIVTKALQAHLEALEKQGLLDL